MADVPEGSFKVDLRFAWLTGCRPQESIRIEKRHVDLKNNRIVLSPRESKGKKQARVVYLVDEAKALLRPMLDAVPSGILFRNANGTPLDPLCSHRAFCRLQIVTGKKRLKDLGLEPAEVEIEAAISTLKPMATIDGQYRAKRPAELREEAKRKLTFKMAKKHANKCCAYLFRHSFADHAIRRGVDPMTVSVLLGHTDVSTLGKRLPVI